MMIPPVPTRTVQFLEIRCRLKFSSLWEETDMGGRSMLAASMLTTEMAMIAISNM